MLKSKNSILRYTLTMLFAITALAGMAFTSSYYSKSSLLSSGKWVKIRVKDNGIYQISYDDLRQMGFSNPSKVAVYGFGGSRLTANVFESTMHDDIHQTATYHTSDGRILFYGEGDFSYRMTSESSFSSQRNIYDNYGYYFLSDCKNPESVSSVNWEDRSECADYHYNITVIDNDVQNIGQGGGIFHDKILSAGESETFDFNVSNYYSGVNGYIMLKTAAATTTRSSFDVATAGDITTNSTINLTINQLSSTSKIFRTQSAKQIFTANGENVAMSVTIGLPATSSATYAAVDYVGVAYPRTSDLGDNGALDMQFIDAQSSRNFSIAHSGKNAIVWNITDVDNIYGYKTHYYADKNSVTCSFAGQDESEDGACKIIAFNPDATFATPTIIGDIANQDIHADEVPEMVIITTEALYAQAEELAEIHRMCQGMKVNVYTQQQVYNEFSSGCRAAMAYRRLAKMFYDRDSKTFKYLLLYGASSWDNRAITMPDRDLLVCYEAELETLANDSNTNFVSDNYFGMLEDDYSPGTIQKQTVSIAVGRIATEDPLRASNYNNKVREYITNPPSPKTLANAVYSSDDNNALSHINQAEAAMSEMHALNPAMTFIKAHNLLYPWESSDARIAREVVIGGLKSGAGYFGYSGHGNSTSITGENLWTNTAITSTDYNVPTFVMLASCHTFAFDRRDNGMGELFLAKRNGGAIAVVAACRFVYLEYNQRLNLAIARAYASIDEKSTIGSIYLNAHKALLANNTENGALVNTLCYNLGGDPAVPIPGAKYSVKIASIGGTKVNDSDSASIAVAPHEAIKIKGYVTDKSTGNVRTDFTGNVQLNVYDQPRTLTTLLRDSGDGNTPLDIELNFDLLAMTTASVKKGEFTATLYLPTPAGFNHLNRITAFATSESKATTYGSGECIAMTVVNNESDKALTTSAPEIVEVYLDDESFSDNDCISSTFTYHALINPSEVGLNLSQATIGASTKLTLDYSKSYSNIGAYLTLRDDGMAEMAVPFNSISLGRHILTLSVANTFGQRTTRSIEFNVVKPTISGNISLDNIVARQSATIALNHTFSTTPECHLFIQSDSGATIVSRDNCTFPYQWNLKDQNGAEVADGRYNAYVLMTDGDNFASTPTAEIIVIRQ